MRKSDFIQLLRETQAPLTKMVAMVPEDRLEWAPAKGFMTLAQLLRHLGENWSAIEMMVTGRWPPGDMEEAMKLENLPRATKAEATEALEKDLEEAVAYLEDEVGEEEFFTRVVTAPWGFRGEIWKAVLMIKDHQLHHKMQLHIYLKLLGLPVNTGTLYGM